MTIYIGADHNGYELKESLRDFLKGRGYQVADLGAGEYKEGDDYPDIAAKVAKKVSLEHESARGVLICGSGVGVNVVANKFRNIRAAIATNPDQAYDSRNDDDSNILCLAANYTQPKEAQKITLTWLETPFGSKKRYKRRLEKIQKIEQELCNSVNRDTLR